MRIRRSLTCATALVAALAATPFTAFADPPAHAPAHGYRAKHAYTYYPQHEIYYSPESSLWFWLEHGDWRFGASLPAPYRQYTNGGIRIELDSDRPYTEHSRVVRQYGGGSKKHKGKHGH